MADNYRFEIETTSFKQKIKDLQSKFPNFIKTIMKRLGARLLAKVKLLTPVDTGLLRRSWFLTEPEATSSDVKLEIKNNVSYGSSVEFGRTRGRGTTVGRFMLKRGITEIESNSPQILESEIQKFCNDNMR